MPDKPSPSLRNPANWLLYVLPLATYMLLAVPNRPEHPYQLLGRFALQVLLTAATLWLATPALKSLSWKLSPITWLVGVAGAALWLLVAAGHWEWRLAANLGWSSWQEQVARPGFDPFSTFADAPTALALFLVTRAIGLVLIVPLAEELLLRGLVLRMISTADDWHQQPIGKLTPWAWFAASAYGVASHPAEPLAAALWFTLITWLAVRTNSFLACVVAHAVANAALMTYVIALRDWSLW